MNRITVRQCNKWCCQMKPHKLRFWLVRSQHFEADRQTPTFSRAIEIANNYAYRTSK